MNYLFIVSGISGSGKTTIAQGFAESHDLIYLSSDQMRGIIGKDENDQSVTPKVFETLKYFVEALAKNEHSVILDSTALTPKTRKEFIDIGRKYKMRVTSIVVNCPLSIAKKRNSERERVVPEDVIDKQHAKFVIPTTDEVDEVIFVENY